ncbi:Myb_DNA-bind_3 domain-containing protein [Cephalotus follicularis]|uniref:Myb_DNA-bind_3 domain-containing protein n=1 Tax=Cephalotus follicularis TaxID=3775 RepID=A0A1Q3CPR8_CEPFO|nr:Myb_DNA-bind_3 domain-containing protein [Cephalotus follicularis]
MDVSTPSTSKQKRKKVNNDSKEPSAKRQWSSTEDAKLVESLLEICMDPCFKNEQVFKAGFLKEVERLMAVKILGTDLRVNPHIDSRYRLLRRQYGAIYEMLGPNGSGFGWNDKEKYVDYDQDVFDNWVKSHPHAKGLRRKPFPHYADFTIIWGKDRASGEGAETPADEAEEIEKDFFEQIYSSGLNGTEGSANIEDFVHVADVGIGMSSPGVDWNGGNAGTEGEVAASDASTKSKKRSKVEVTKHLISNMDRMADNISIIATAFQHESVSAGRMEKIMQEMLNMDGFTIEEIIKAAEVLISNPNKMVVFFNLPAQHRPNYVLSQLL